MATRRNLLKAGAIGGAVTVIPLAASRWGTNRRAAGALDPATLPKYVTPLVIPPAMPRAFSLGGVDHYAIGVKQFRQQILPPGWPATTVWGYGSMVHSGTFNYPSFTIEARAGRPVQVTWVNALVDGAGNYRPHLLPVDPTLHWANPPGGMAGRDSRPDFTATPGRYTGPVPIVTHVHGAHVSDESDGYAEAWYLPLARNIPAGYARVGSKYAEFRASAFQRFGAPWLPGTATFRYGNDQPATTLWYHDHSLGLTRVNVYAGPAGFYLLRGGPADLPAGVLPGPAPARGDAAGTVYHEIPIAIQDRAFLPDGALSYPDSRAAFDGYPGPYVPGTDVSPLWNPEVFGDTMVVNGRTWPVLDVRARRYRFRLLNGCNSRFLLLKLVSDPQAARPVSAMLPWHQIGAEGGFLPAPATSSRLLMAPAERADVVVDFGGLPAGTEVYLINEAPDEPFGGGEPGVDFAPADPATTGQVMKFRVVAATGADTSVPPDALTLPGIAPLGPASVTRQLSLNEMMSMYTDGPAMAMLGTLDAQGNGVSRGWADPITETPVRGATEVWEFHNFTADAHPIHLHQVQFQVLDRQVAGGAARPPEPGETGFKDTVIAFPGEITRVKSTFDLAGLYVWHCHIVEHEDNEMMRPFRVT